MKTIYLQGLDERLTLLREIFLQHGFHAVQAIPDKAEENAVFIFAPGEKSENIRATLEKAEKGSLFFLWKKDTEILALAEEKKICVKSILENDAYLLKNAQETAEGVLASVIEKTDRTLSSRIVAMSFCEPRS